MRPGPFTRARTLYAVLVLGLAALALEPSPRIERALDACLLPTRALAELAAPLEWLASPEVRAAEADLARDAATARARAEALFLDEQDAALPTRAELALGRRFVHGEVVRRGEGDLDSIVVRLASLDGIEAGMPVVAGDHYVGRVTRALDEAAREVAVALVTGKSFFVGAEVVDPGDDSVSRAPVELTAGGLAPRVGGDEGSLELAVHNPSRKPSSGGLVVVREPRFPAPERGLAHTGADRFAELADGFRLGLLERVALDGGAHVFRIRPGLDYQSGLFQVLVVAPADGGPSERRLALDTFEPEAWVPLSALPGGEIDARRRGRRFTLPFGAPLARGAAIAWAGHFLGRVERCDAVGVDARWLGDPGLVLAALARVEGEARPFALGELVSLGEQDEDGAIRLRWNARVALGGEGGPARAELFTGSGVEGVPRGLYLGTAELPRGSGRHFITLHPAPNALRVEHGLGWRGLPETRASGEEAP